VLWAEYKAAFPIDAACDAARPISVPLLTEKAGGWNGGSLPILHSRDYSMEQAVPQAWRIIPDYVESVGGSVLQR